VGVRLMASLDQTRHDVRAVFGVAALGASRLPAPEYARGAATAPLGSGPSSSTVVSPQSVPLYARASDGALADASRLNPFVCRGPLFARPTVLLDPFGGLCVIESWGKIARPRLRTLRPAYAPI